MKNVAPTFSLLQLQSKNDTDAVNREGGIWLRNRVISMWMPFEFTIEGNGMANHYGKKFVCITF